MIAFSWREPWHVFWQRQEDYWRRYQFGPVYVVLKPKKR